METFFRVNSAEGDFFDLIADHLFTALSQSEQIDKLKEVFSFASQSHNDGSTLAALKVLDKVYRDEAMRGSSMIDGKMLGQWLKEVYWCLPDARKTDTYYDSLHGRHEDVFGATLVETKAHIIRQIIREWKLEELNESSIDAFRFLIAAFNPWSKEWGKRQGESVHEEKARGRKVYKEEKEGILQMIREHLKWQRNSECLDQWIKQPVVPEDIQNILIVARARNGGAKLALRDIGRNEMLKPLDPDNRSSVALALHNQICFEIAALDAGIKQLIANMKNIDTYKTDVVGESEMILGDIKIFYPDLSGVIIEVKLPEYCPEALGRDVFGRTRRHIEKWIQASSMASKLDISLTVSGGAEALLDLTAGYSKGKSV